MPKEKNLLRVVASTVNIDVLNVIRQEPSSPREIARFLGKNETDISRRLRLMEKAGIVNGAWTRKKGRNVKVYALRGFHAEVDFGPEGLTLQLKTATESKSITADAIASFEVPSTSNFVGRQRELAMLAGEEGLHVVIGLPGIGKTSLGVAFAASVLKERPVLWHTVREVDSFAYVVSKIAVFLARFGFSDALDYIRGGGDEDRVNLELIGKGLNRIRSVVIFDDYHRRRDERLDALLEHLWRSCSTVKIVVLSRSRPRFYSLESGVREYWLQGLTVEETRMFLSDKGVETGESGTEELWRKVLGHPLSLTLYCALVKERGKGVSVDIVKDENITGYFLDELSSALSEDEKELLTALSVFRSPVAAKALSDTFNLKKVLQSSHNLEMKMLINRVQDKLVIHELLREAFYRFLDNPREAHLVVARYYNGVGTSAETLEAIFHYIRAENIGAVISIVKEEIEDEKYRFVEQGLSAPLLDLLDGVKVPPDSEDLFYLLCLRGKARSRLGEWESAAKELTEALRIADKAGRKFQAYATKCLAEHYYFRGDFTNTMRDLLKATEIFQDLGISDSLERAYTQLARLSFSMGRHDKAKYYAELAERLSRPAASHSSPL